MVDCMKKAGPERPCLPATVSPSLRFKRAKRLYGFPHRDFCHGFLFGCLSSLFFDFCFSFSA
jgi:hypothetical protein